MEPDLLSLGSAQRMAVLASLGILDAPAERSFQVLVDAARDLIGAPTAILSLLTDEHQRFVSFSRLPESSESKRKVPLTDPFCNVVVSQNKALVVPDAKEAGISANEELGIAAYMGVPLQMDNGITVGTICVVESRVREWTDMEFTILEKLARLTVEELTVRNDFRQQKSQLESRLRHAQKMESIGQFASGVVHDFNNVLAAIQIYAEMLESNLTDRPDLIPFVDNINEALGSAKETVQQLLDWSRPNQGSRSNMLLANVVQSMMPLLCVTLSKKVEVSFRNYTDNGMIFGNANSLRQALLNLCLNAEHAVRERGGEINISLHDHTEEEGSRRPGALSPGAYVNLRVADNGHGIASDLLDRLFEPYFTTKPVGEGTGLGLWTVAGIVEGHNATIGVESELDVGTTFNVYFPRVNGLSAGTKAAFPTERQAAPTSRILVVDDEPLIANGIGMLLSSRGYEPEVFTESGKALRALRTNPDLYVLVIADQTMPKLTGAELLEEWRRLDPTKPIVFCSAQLGHDSDLAAKADACCPKPFGLRTLTETIEPLISAYRQIG